MKPENQNDSVSQADRKSDHEPAPAENGEGKQEGVVGLFGTIDYDPDYDYKRERQRCRG